ncbi:MAG: hypothetical protein SGI71_05175 [Verrucomicrobiota bacterium]|nr:hypothetical protein [Verrucomicrobiota bacterium]
MVTTVDLEARKRELRARLADQRGQISDSVGELKDSFIPLTTNVKRTVTGISLAGGGLALGTLLWRLFRHKDKAGIVTPAQKQKDSTFNQLKPVVFSVLGMLVRKGVSKFL